jgi:hypothetical protein
MPRFKVTIEATTEATSLALAQQDAKRIEALLGKAITKMVLKGEGVTLIEAKIVGSVRSA